MYVQNKHKRGNQNKVPEAKTAENIKYKPILSIQALITRKLEFEKWVKILHRGQNVTLEQPPFFEFTATAVWA